MRKQHHRHRYPRSFLVCAKLGAIVILSLVMFLPNRGQADTCDHRLRVGVIVPLSGGPISSGEAVRNGVLLADEKYDKNNCVDFLFEDDQFQPKNSVSAARKLIEVNKVDALVVHGTPTSLAVVPIAEKSGTPLISFSIHEKVVEDKKFVVKHWSTSEALHEAISKEVSARGYKKVAIVSTVNDATLNLRDKFVSSNVAPVVFNQEIDKDEYDFKAIVTKLIAVEPDAVYVLVFPPQTGHFVKKLRQVGYKGELFSYSIAENEAELVASDYSMIGLWYADSDDTVGEGFAEDYSRRYGKHTVLGAGNGFDVAKMLIESRANKGSLNDYLHRIKDFKGALGTYSATSNNDFDIPVTIKLVFRDGFRKAK